MANLDPVAGWDDVPQLETNTLAIGGPGGPANSQALALAARTNQLKERLDSIGGDNGFMSIGDIYVARISQLIEEFGSSNAWVQALAYPVLHIDKNVSKAGSYVIPAGQRIIFSASVTQTDDLIAFDGDLNDDWSMEGRGNIQRTGVKPTSQTLGSIGIRCKRTFNYSISGAIRVRYFGEAGFVGDGAGLLTGNVGKSRIAGLKCEENYENWRLLAGFPAEYVSMVNCIASKATRDNVYLETGNINWVGGSVTEAGRDNVQLIHPASGANPHHGMFVGVLINHCVRYNLYAEGVSFAHVFECCMFYGEPIYLKNSGGVLLNGGHLGCDVYVEESGGASSIGVNQISNMYVIEGKAVIQDPGSNIYRRNLLVKNCFDKNGPWVHNTVGNGYASAKPPSNIAVGAGVTALDLAFTSVQSNTQEAYDSVTGVFTAKAYGVVEATVCLSVTTTANPNTNGHTVYFMRDDNNDGTFDIISIAPLLDSGATNGFANATFKIPVSSGGKVKFRYNCPDRATNAVTINAAYSSISFEISD